MALLNLFQLLQNDDQITFTDKVNSNFDAILSLGGGPLGPTGFSGNQGVPGSQGIQGTQGDPGVDGAKWYVLPSTDTPSDPTIGDFWLQTDTLNILEYMGSPTSWVDLGFTLTATGVFKDAGAYNLVFTDNSPYKSLVLSNIDYGTGTDSGGTLPPNYKLKIVTNSGTQAIKFGINDGGSENNEIYQPTIGVQKISSTSWQWNFDNNNGDTFFHLNGNYFAAYAQASSIGRFDFGSQSRYQNSSTQRHLSFTNDSAGTEYFSIGRHSGITTSTDRLLSVRSTGQVAIGDSFSNVISGDVLSDYFVDIYAPQLANTVAAVSKNFRLRAKLDSTRSNELRVFDVRNFVDNSVTPYRSAQFVLSHAGNNTQYHGINFHGGAKDSSFATRASLRLSYGSNTNYYFSGDVNGRIGIGSSSFIEDYNDSATALNQFQTRLNIQGENNTSTVGASLHSGIHFLPYINGSSQTSVGITAGGTGTSTTLDANKTMAGILFKSDGYNSATRYGTAMNFLTSRSDDLGAKLRESIDAYGNHFFYSKDVSVTNPNITEYLTISVGGLENSSSNKSLMSDGIARINTSNIPLILNSSTSNSSSIGNVGVGSSFSNSITGTLKDGVYYKVTSAAVYKTVSYSVGDIIKGTTPLAALTSGVAVLAKPASRFHVDTVNNGVTFGTRYIDSTTHLSTIGTGSFTVGKNIRADGTGMVVIGDSPFNVPHSILSTSQYSLILGHNGSTGISMSGSENSNKILLATRTAITDSSDYSFATNLTGGDFDSVNPQTNLKVLVEETYCGLEIEYKSQDGATDIGFPLLITRNNDDVTPVYTPILVVNSFGNVGIGKAPDYSIQSDDNLDVEGNIRLSGDIVTGSDVSGWIQETIAFGDGKLTTSAVSGTFSVTNYTGIIRYKVIGKTIFINYRINITQTASTAWDTYYRLTIPGGYSAAFSGVDYAPAIVTGVSGILNGTFPTIAAVNTTYLSVGNVNTTSTGTFNMVIFGNNTFEIA